MNNTHHLACAFAMAALFLVGYFFGHEVGFQNCLKNVVQLEKMGLLFVPARAQGFIKDHPKYTKGYAQSSNKDDDLYESTPWNDGESNAKPVN